mgnify:CR=1 FL=1
MQPNHPPNESPHTQTPEPPQSPIMPEAEARRKPVFDPTGRVEQINPDEVKIADVRRHPIFGLIFLVLATKIYQTSQLIITVDNVTQVMQVGIFHRKVSEISMENVEDVTAHQKGILQTFFNYGRVHIETAGEQNNYDFIYCPNPNAYAKAIQDARVEFLKTYGT